MSFGPASGYYSRPSQVVVFQTFPVTGCDVLAYSCAAARDLHPLPIAPACRRPTIMREPNFEKEQKQQPSKSTGHGDTKSNAGVWGGRSDLRPKSQNGRADSPAVSLECKNSGPLPYLPLLTTFFSSFPGVNLATLRAAILRVAPVCGFRPLRALRCETENVPNPIKATRSPFLRAAVTLSTVVSIAVVAAAFEMLQAPAIRSTRSALFMLSPDTLRFGSRAFSRGGKLKARAPAMAILAYVAGLSMGNTCQQPVVTPETNGCICSTGKISRK